MGARAVNIRCADSECQEEVVTATLSDNVKVWEIALADNVIDAKALHNGMGIGDFGSVIVLHVSDDKEGVKHSIVAQDYQPS